ncbi:MAG: hypothetical protein ACT4QE_22250, partial [Anaerolineales bacterium]
TGNGPDVRSTVVGATTSNTLKVDLQVDYSVFSGIAVDEESKVYVVSGGTPAGVGTNPSPTRGEILVFPDSKPSDRRGDYVDLRGDTPPNPPINGGNTGDGDSDRFDHLFWTAPLDQLSVTPTGVAGLSRGFLLYLNRARNNAAAFTYLPNGSPQGDDTTTSAAVVFDDFDPGHQVAGGDDQNPPVAGDDGGAIGSPAVSGFGNGGFEFWFGASSPSAVWNGFYLNSNGNLTLSAGDTDNTPTPAELLSGSARIAGAWMDLNPSSRSVYTSTFPIQALGFANINHFVARWINVPEFGLESCGSSNSLSVSLYDDGTNADENASSPSTVEGSTDLRFTPIAGTSLLSSSRPRIDRSGNLCFNYGRMDALGTASSPVLTGYSNGGGATDPGEGDVGELARQTDTSAWSYVGIWNTPSAYEYFDTGTLASGGSSATPDFDLRAESNDAALATPVNQSDLNRGQACFFGNSPPLNSLYTPLIIR